MNASLPGRRGHLGAGIILRGIKEIRHKAAPSKPGTDDTGDLSAYHPKLFTFACVGAYADRHAPTPTPRVLAKIGATSVGAHLKIRSYTCRREPYSR